jgi:hypothetical protein
MPLFSILFLHQYQSYGRKRFHLFDTQHHHLLSFMTSFYVLIRGREGVRHFPPHGYTPKSITEKRFRENTTSAALSYNILLPFLQRVNKAVEAHVDSATDITTEEFAKIAKNASLETLVSFVDVSLRVAAQNGAACVLINAQKPLADSVVYSWDMYPRLHRKYIGDLLHKLYLPRFLAGLMGPETHANDLAIFQEKVAPLAAFEDSVKRHLIYSVADIVVDTGRALVESQSKVKQIARRLTVHATTLLGKAAGAAAGRAVAADKGEYWGEYVGAFASALVSAKIIVALRLGNKNELAN